MNQKDIWDKQDLLWNTLCHWVNRKLLLMQNIVGGFVASLTVQSEKRSAFSKLAMDQQSNLLMLLGIQDPEESFTM